MNDMDGGTECDTVATVMEDTPEESLPTSCTDGIDADGDGILDMNDMDGGMECDTVAGL
jgi:hypothetical protein